MPRRRDTDPSSPPPEGADASPRDEPVFDLLRRIRSGDADPRTLLPSARVLLVEVLLSEGASVYDTAALLRTSERTIARDREKVRESWALEQDPRLPARILGALTRQYEQVYGLLWKQAKDPSAPAGLRARAARAAWRTGREYVQTLQSVGLIPTAELAVRASVTHDFGEAPELLAEAELIAELAARTQDAEHAEFRERAERAARAARALPSRASQPPEEERNEDGSEVRNKDGDEDGDEEVEE